MRLRVPMPIRVLRALTGLVTVWCLGCSAYDPMVGFLFAGSSASVMNCVEDATPRGGPGTSTLAASPEHASPTPTIADAGASGVSRSFDCGCQSCTAPSVSSYVAQTMAAPTPSTPSLAISDLRSIEREPLVPPPQSLL